MDHFAAKIETLEHRWMRAWMERDRNTMKALASRDFIYLLGSSKPVLLDRASWLEAATTRFRCSGYSFGQVYVRKHGSSAVFAAPLTIEARMGGEDWSGTMWVTDLWSRSSVRRKWRLLERVIARPETEPDMPAAIKSMQLWR